MVGRTETEVKIKSGGTVPITRADVAVAALDVPEYTAHGRNDFWVMVHVGARLIPAVPLMRAVLGGQEPHNTNEAEMRFRELGFRIFVTRLYDSSGQPIRLTNEQIKGARP
ncbi:hypothetical protein ACH414_32870 [Streptomyces sp. NPDC020422]|uniref:hypothetical protein n=1 Tax=Streptomyces sp. NPDC020422 TaxID=3365074 RepID=UPI00379CCDDD